MKLSKSTPSEEPQTEVRFGLIHAFRPFACDRCGCMHDQQTNHEGQIYSQKCKNWPCTAGTGDYTSMTYWGGNASLAKSSHVDPNNHQPVILYFKNGINKHGAPPDNEEIIRLVTEALAEAEKALDYCRGKYVPRSNQKVKDALHKLYKAKGATDELAKFLSE